MTTMNLITEQWIPVTWRAGGTGLVGLDELFAKANEIGDLAVKPHERIALMRLLMCITQAALDGPADHYAWEDCREDIPGRAHDYLRKWKAAFDLFGDGPRFLQVPNLKSGKEDGEATDATKLDLALATGHNATVFDNAGGSERPQAPARLALSLLAFQNLSPGGRIGVAKWNGSDTAGAGSSNHAPCIPASMLHCFLQGQTLLETLHLNLLDREQALDLNGPDSWGRPCWELPVLALTAKAEVRNATMTYLGRLAPLARAVRLFEDGTRMVLANGLNYPAYPAFREASVTLVERKDGPGLLSASLERSLWRQLPAVAVRRRATKDALCGPAALANLPDNTPASLWLGALVTDKAKIEDVVEGIYHIPAGMFKDLGRQTFEAGVAFAEGWEMALVFSVRTWAETLKLQPAPSDKARRHFWTAIEQHVPTLLALTDTPGAAADFAATPWGKAVRTAAQEAYEFACPRQNPRQIEAFAKGRQQLFLRKPKPKPDGSATAPAVKTRKNHPS
jgi:CRISPR system Cascade subunit CasA